jgi:hypothetical protein
MMSAKIQFVRFVARSWLYLGRHDIDKYDDRWESKTLLALRGLTGDRILSFGYLAKSLFGYAQSGLPQSFGC